MMFYVKGYRCGKALLVLIIVALSISCDTGGVADAYLGPTPYDPPPPIDDTVGGIDVTTLPYSYLGSTDSDGLVDLAPVLSSYGYLVPNVQNVEIKDSNNEELQNIWVYYWIDQQNDLFYIKTKDPDYLLSDAYQVLSIRDNLPTGILVVPLIQVIMKAYATFETLSSISSLFSLDIYFSEQRHELVFEGTIGQIYDSLSLLGAVSKLPVVLKRNIESKIGKLTADKASKINPNDASSDLKTYLKAIGGYILANDETTIRVTLNMLDGAERYLDIEVLSDNSPLLPNMLNYYVRVAIEGDLSSFQYDIPFFGFGEAPDFYAKIKIGGVLIKETDTDDDTYVTELRFLENYIFDKVEIPFSIPVGEEVEITILDDDVLFDDEVGKLVFNFDDNTLSYRQTSLHAGQPIASINTGFF